MNNTNQEIVVTITVNGLHANQIIPTQERKNISSKEIVNQIMKVIDEEIKEAKKQNPNLFSTLTQQQVERDDLQFEFQDQLINRSEGNEVIRSIDNTPSIFLVEMLEDQLKKGEITMLEYLDNLSNIEENV